MGDLDKAESVAEQAAETTRNSRDIYLIPDRLHTLATIQAAKGKCEEADGLLTKASDYVDSMLASSPSLRIKSALVPSMGGIFSDHAALTSAGQPLDTQDRLSDFLAGSYDSAHDSGTALRTASIRRPVNP